MSNKEVESIFPYNPNIDLSKRQFTVMTDVLELDKNNNVLVFYNPTSKELQYYVLKANTAKGIVEGTLAVRSRGFRIDHVKCGKIKDPSRLLMRPKLC